MDIKTIKGGEDAPTLTTKKEAKRLKWVNTSPAIIKKPLRLVRKIFGVKSIEAELAERCAADGIGHTVNLLARRALAQ